MDTYLDSKVVTLLEMKEVTKIMIIPVKMQKVEMITTMIMRMATTNYDDTYDDNESEETNEVEYDDNYDYRENEETGEYDDNYDDKENEETGEYNDNYDDWNKDDNTKVNIDNQDDLWSQTSKQNEIGDDKYSNEYDNNFEDTEILNFNADDDVTKEEIQELEEDLEELIEEEEYEEIMEEECEEEMEEYYEDDRCYRWSV